jgi:hypothetical protein
MSTEPREDPIPEADRQEQETPRDADLRFRRAHVPDEPEADVVEQDLPVVEVEEDELLAVDGERIEPVHDADWFDEQSDR